MNLQTGVARYGPLTIPYAARVSEFIRRPLVEKCLSEAREAPYSSTLASIFIDGIIATGLDALRGAASKRRVSPLNDTEHARLVLNSWTSLREIPNSLLKLQVSEAQVVSCKPRTLISYRMTQ